MRLFENQDVENATLLVRILRYGYMKTMTKNATFRKCSPGWIFFKTIPFRICVDAWKQNFSITITSHYRSQFSSRNPKCRTHPSLCCLLCLGLSYFKPSCVLSTKFITPNYSCWLSKKARGEIIRKLTLPLSKLKPLKWLVSQPPRRNRLLTLSLSVFKTIQRICVDR